LKCCRTCRTTSSKCFNTEGEASLRGHLKGHAGKEQAGSQSYIPPRLRILFFSSHGLRERVLALVALDVANNFLDASPDLTPTFFLVSAIFLYISRAGFGDLSDPRQPCLTRFGKFCGVCFNAGYNAALAGLNSSAFCFDVGHTDPG
jgi:hypothetical protein